MELGACDLQSFLKSTTLSVPDICRLWHSLVKSVDAAHDLNIIHRDIKPQNFLLVPTTPFGDRVLAATTVPRENFVFQVEDGGAEEEEEHQQSDVKLTLRDPTTGKEEVLRLRVKLGDFGLAQPLELSDGAGASAASHVSIKGLFGTVLYMAPETLRPADDCGTKRVGKHVDVWALGVILFQMLEGKTPFDPYFRADGPIGVAVAASNRDIHREVMVFDRTKKWIAERDKALLVSSSECGGKSKRAPTLATTKRETIARTLLGVWIQTKFLFRMCELCLTFDAADRVAVRDLGRWIGVAFDKDWFVAERDDACTGAEGWSTTKLVDETRISSVGTTIARSVLPDVWTHSAGPDGAAGPGSAPGKEEDIDAAMAELQSWRGCKVRWLLRSKVFGIVLLVMLAAAGLLVAGVLIIRAAGGAGKGHAGETVNSDVPVPQQPLVSTPPAVGGSWDDFKKRGVGFLCSASCGVSMFETVRNFLKKIAIPGRVYIA